LGLPSSSGYAQDVLVRKHVEIACATVQTKVGCMIMAVVVHTGVWITRETVPAMKQR